MKKQTTKTKLALDRETIRQLDATQLAVIKGAAVGGSANPRGAAQSCHSCLCTE